MYNFRTDLATERRDIYQKVNKQEGEIDGIESTKEEINDNLKIERVKITNENGEKAIRKTNRKLYNNRYKKFKNSSGRRNRKCSKCIIRRTKENIR